MPETISYPGRDALSVMAAQVNSVEPERRPRAYLARSIRAALDTHAHDLDALARRLDVHDQQIAALQADVIEHIDQADDLCPTCGENVTISGRPHTHPVAELAQMLTDAAEPDGPVHAIAVTFYVAAPQDLDADTIRAMFGAVLDHSTAREALAAGLDGADPRVTLLGVTDPTAPAR